MRSKKLRSFHSWRKVTSAVEVWLIKRVTQQSFARTFLSSVQRNMGTALLYCCSPSRNIHVKNMHCVEFSIVVSLNLRGHSYHETKIPIFLSQNAYSRSGMAFLACWRCNASLSTCTNTDIVIVLIRLYYAVWVLDRLAHISLFFLKLQTSHCSKQILLVANTETQGTNEHAQNSPCDITTT